MATTDFKICLDAGHGMGNVSKGVFDSGAVSGGVKEASVTLDWVLTLKWVGLNWFGVKPEQVYLTRDDDTDFSPVGRRDDNALAHGCTHFVAIHCNSGDPRAAGSEAYYAKKGSARSKAFAIKVLAACVGAMGRGDRGVKREDQSQHSGLAVFGLADKMDSCLVEVGFITNPNDRARMVDREARIWFAVKFWRDVMGLKAIAGPWA